MEADVRLSQALAALAHPSVKVDAHAESRVLVARSLAGDRRRWSGISGREVDDADLARALRERGEQVLVVATASVDAELLRLLHDRPPALLILAGPATPELLADLRRIAARSGRRTMALLGPDAAVHRAPTPSADAPLVLAADRDELARLLAALATNPDAADTDAGADVLLALAPTPPWLPRQLARSELTGRDVVGFVPAEALSLDWVDWLRSCGEREARQLVVPLGVTPVELEPRALGLEQAVVAHALERWTGPIYPAPQVLALLREGIARHRSPHPTVADDDDPVARALWQQARRALPRLGDGPGMEQPDPALSLRVPTAAFLAQRGLLRLRAGERLIADGLADLEEELRREAGDPDPLERAEAVLEGAAEVLSDQESKVVLRGHGIEVTRQAFATSASGAASFADKIGYPVALKALSPDLRRKREVGAVELDVANAAAVKRAYGQIVSNVEEQAPTARLDGVVVAEMIEPGLDLRCGGLRMRNDEVALYAQPVTIGPVEPILVRSPLDARDALLVAEAVLAASALPLRRRAGDPDVAVLARLLLRIDGLFRHTGERLLAVDLDPVRLLAPAQPGNAREYVTLDARIVQRPHLDGL